MNACRQTATVSFKLTTHLAAFNFTAGTGCSNFDDQNPKQKTTKSFEQTLWDTADKLRGTVESSEYKHVVLSPIFLKFVSDKFEERKKALVNEGYPLPKTLLRRTSGARSREEAGGGGAIELYERNRRGS